MKKLTIILTLVIIGLTAQSGFGQENKTEKEKFIETVKLLEQQPLHKDAKELRSWAMKYSEDVDTKVCENIFGLFMGENVGGELLSQYLIAMAAFKLSNPEKKADENAAQLAGLESAVKVYEITSATGSRVKLKKFEQLKTIRNSGKLADVIKAAKCR